VLAALIAVAGLGVAACAGGGSAGGSSSLKDAMGQVQNGPIARSFFAWADQKALRKLTGISSVGDTSNKKKVKPRWSRLATAGLPDAGRLEPQFTDTTGIDPFSGDRTMTVGVAPEEAGRVDGAAISTVKKKFQALGAQAVTAGGRIRMELAPDDQVDSNDSRLAGDVYLALNRVVIKGSSLAFGLATGPVDAVLGGGPALSDDADEGAIAACLGDVVAAEILMPPPGAAAGVSRVGVGVRRPGAITDSVQEVLCETAGRQQLAPLAATITSRVQQGAPLPGTGLQVQQRFVQPVVDQTPRGRAVRLSVNLVAPARAGFLLFDMGPQDSLLAFLGGGASPATVNRP
jgi:hypothetical protein